MRTPMSRRRWSCCACAAAVSLRRPAGKRSHLWIPSVGPRSGRRVSTMQGIAIALGLGIVYFVVVALFGRLGEVEILPPLVGAWAPTALAMLFAINRLTMLRT